MMQKISESLLQKYRQEALAFAARAVPQSDGSEEKPDAEKIEAVSAPKEAITEGASSAKATVKAVAAVKNQQEKTLPTAVATENPQDKLPQGSTVEPEENPQTDAQNYAEFLKLHPARGGLKIQLTAANGNFPVSGATIQVAVELKGKDKVIFNNTTDESGIVDSMPLPALPSDYSQTAATATGSGTEYKVSIFSPGFLQLKDIGVSIFDSIKTILPLELTPIAPEAQKGVQ